MSSIIHCQNMLFLVGLKFNNLTGSVNTSLCRASVLPCVGTGAGARSPAEEGAGRDGELKSICWERGGAVSPG